MRYALVVVLLAGCNQLIGFDDGDLRVVDASQGPRDGVPDATPDAEIHDARPDPDAPAGACNPYEQTGCGGGQMCTWIHTDTPNNGGIVGCVPLGTVAIGAACSRGLDGPTTGYDDCVAGSYCSYGQCQAFCTMTPDSCGVEQTCGLYAGLLGNPTDKGLCDFTCNPVAQTRSYDGAASCGGGAQLRGCYWNFQRDATCAPVPPPAASLQHNDTAYDWPGNVYFNGCAPGFAPLMGASNDAASRVICTAFCRPAETSAEARGGAGGVLGSGYTCGDRGAAGEECRFVWVFMQAGEASAAENGIGFCWQPENYLFDFVNDGTADEPMPRCEDTTSTDADADTYADHFEIGCAPFP